MESSVLGTYHEGIVSKIIGRFLSNLIFLRLPEASLPPMWLVPKILFQSLPIALVGFTITFSMASILAKKGNYQIRANQEAAALVHMFLYNFVSSI